MISINFMGGLGNQLFQVASTYSLALSNNDNAVFNFNNCWTPLQGNKIIKYRNTIFKNFTHVDNFIAENYYQEPSHNYNEIQYKPNLFKSLINPAIRKYQNDFLSFSIFWIAFSFLK